MAEESGSAMEGWPFAGRNEELRHLTELLSDPAARGVILAGASGVGKTRLALALLEAARRANLATERVMATSTKADLPFGAVAMLLPELGRGPAVGEVAELARRLAACVVERAAGRRLVLLVDDAHLLDDGSAMLIHQLAMTNAAFVIATIRTREPVPGPVMALWKEDLAERVDLEPLPDRAVEEAVSGFLQGPVAGAVVASLVRRSGGNMLFVRELVHGALAQGALRCEGGIWHLVGELHPTDRLVELVDARLADVDPDEREILELLGLGEPLNEAEFGTFATDEQVERLEQRGLVATSMADGRLSLALAHPLYGEVLREGLSAARARRLTRRLADSAEAAGSGRADDLLRIGSWRLRCGGGRPEMMLAAAKVAFERFDYQLAEQLAQAAVEGGAGFAAKVLIAELTAVQGDRAAAEAQLSGLATAAPDDAARTQVALARADNALLRMRAGDAVRICDEALAGLTDPQQRLTIGVRRAWAIGYVAGPRAGIEVTEALSRDGDASSLAALSLGWAFCLAHTGRTSEALETVAMGEEAHRRVAGELHWPLAVHDFYRCLALGAAGRLVEMEELAESAYRAAAEEGSRWNEALAAYALAAAYAERGRVQRAGRYAQEAATLFRSLGDLLLLGQSLLTLAYVSALAGEPGASELAMSQFDEMQPAEIWHFGGGLHARAWTAVSLGDLPRARQLFEQAGVAGEEIGDLARAGAAWHGLVRIGHPKLAADHLRKLSGQVEGDLAAVRADHAEALAGRKARQLEVVSRNFEGLGADLLAAEASADAAVVWRQAGETRKATTAEHRAANLLACCEGAVTPATGSVETRAQLTPAERETAVLAGEGRSNKEIAAELGLSTRTVESRLQHVYSKLGISSRTELRSTLSRLKN